MIISSLTRMVIAVNHALTPKQEAFAVEYVGIGNASEAYRRAYNAKNMKRDTIHSRARELLKHGGIAAKVTQLRADLATDNEVTFGEVAAVLCASITAAMEAGQHSAAVSGCMGLAKLGWVTCRKAASVDRRFRSVVPRYGDDFSQWPRTKQ
jgi:phage terminase small subunit